MRSYVFGGGDGAPRRIDVLANKSRRPFKKRGAKWEKALAWAVTAWTLGMAPVVYAHPILDAAGAGVTVSGTTNMNITGEATNNLIKWVDFSIGSGEKVTFDAKNYLNYVTGSARSDILGTLTGGGSIYLVNPNGILIGDNATVNVGNLHLSTKALTAEQLADYTTATSALPSAAIGNGDVINLGNLNANVISVEGNNITFKNYANVKNGDAINTNVTLTANSTGEIHIGSQVGVAEPAVTPSYTMNGTDKKYMYKLVNASDLNALYARDLTANYMLGWDLDMTNYSNFSPIGKEQRPFTGRFDGLNHEIKNLNINGGSNSEDIGLFGCVQDATIENLRLSGGSVTGGTNVGGVVGRIKTESNSGTIRNVYNMNNVTGDHNVGGIVGHVQIFDGTPSGQITIQNVYNAGTITSTGKNPSNESNVGGIVGYFRRTSSEGSITNAYNTGNVTGAGDDVGGIVGYNFGLVENTYNTGTITGADYVKGIAGAFHTTKSTLRYSYNTGTITASGEHTDNSAPDFTGWNIDTDGTNTTAAWRRYGDALPILKAFLTRKDNYTGETKVYDGANTGDVNEGHSYGLTTKTSNQAEGIDWASDVYKVTPKNLTVTFGSTTKEYDGTKDATVGTATLTGLIAGDDVSATATAVYDTKNVGTGKSVSYSGISLTGDKAKNYNLTNAATVTGTGTITAKEITATFADISKTYDGTTNATAGAGSSTDIVTGDAVTITGTAAFADKNVGTDKTVNYTGVTLDGTDAANYTIADTATGTGTIAKANITISTDAVTKTYDGTTSAAGAAAKVTSGTLFTGDSISGGTFAFTDKNARTGKTITVSGVTITDGNNGGNYNVTYENGTGEITRKALLLVATPQTITEGEATPTEWSGNVTGFVEGEGLTAADSLAFALDDPAASAVGSYAVTGSLNGNSFYDYGTNYTFSNAESNDTAFTIKAKQNNPASESVLENLVGDKGAAQEYTNVVGSIESGANTVLPTTNVLPTESVVPTNSVLPTGNNLPTGNTQQTGSNQPTGSVQSTEPAAQENNSDSGEQNETQGQNGLLPAQQTTGGQPAAGRKETQLGLTYTDINMPKSMSVEALAATMNGETTQQSGAPAASNAPATEPTTQNAPTTELTTAVPGTSEANNEEE